jgi:short-subunit dehydrogenase
MKKIHPDPANHNHYAVITGAAAGLGTAFVMNCAARGFSLFLVDLPGQNLSNLADYIKKNFLVDVKYLELDITERGFEKKILNAVQNDDLKIKMLINNAGLGQNDLFENSIDEHLRKMIELNNISGVILTSALLPELKKNDPSYIINVGSLGGFFALPKKTCYAASKGFVRQFSQALRIELKRNNISVSVVCPGPITTNIEKYFQHKEVNWFTRKMVQSPQVIVEKAINGVMKGKAVIIPGRLNRILRRVSSLIPHFIQEQLINRSLKQFKTVKVHVKEVIEPDLIETPSVPA